jgi:PAS domain S-box-containing protein
MPLHRQNSTETGNPQAPWREMYKALSEHSADGVFVFDTTGQLVDANSRFCELAGYSHSEILKLSIHALFPGNDLVGDLSGHDHAPSEPAVVQLRQQREGVCHSLKVTRSIVSLSDGSQLGIITPQDSTEAAVAETEQRFRLLAEAAFEGMAVTQRGKFLEVNDQLGRMFGYPREELLHTSVLECVAPQHRELVAGFMGSDPLQPCEFLALRKDGTVFTAAARARRQRVGDLETHVVAIRDVTEREPADATLQRLRRLDQEALQIARMGHWEYDMVTGQFTFNDQYYRLHGTTAQEVGGYQMSAERFAQHYVHPDDSYLVSEFIRQAADARDADFRFQTEARILRADQEARQVTMWFRIEQDALLRTIRLYGVSQDITERKQAEAALRESEFFLREAQVVAQIGSYDFDVPSGTWTRSAALNELLGISENYPKDIHGWLELIHPEQQDEMLQYFSHAVLTEYHRFDKEYRIIRQDNRQERWVHGLGDLEFDAQGHVTKIIGILQDITQRKRMEAEQTYDEERFRSIFEHSMAGIALVGLEGQYLMVNPAFSKIFGYSSDEFLKTDFLKLTHPDDAEYSRQVMRAVLDQNGNQVQFTKRYLHRDGHTIWAEVSSTLVHGPGGALLHFITHVNDITQRRLAEQALRAAHDEIVTIIDNIPIYIAHISGEQRYQYVNSAYARLFGKTKADFVGHSVGELLHEQAYAIAAPYIARALNGETVAYESNLLPYATGERRILWVQFTPHRDEAGRVIGYFSLAQDITDRKEAEMLIQAQKEQLVAQNEELMAQNEELVSQDHALEAAQADLQQINDELEQRIQARSAELHAANTNLQLANAALLRAGRMKDEFLANMSHELRTPLTGILGLTEVMDKGFYGDLTEKQRHALQMIHESGDHLLQLINDILDLSKVEAGKMELQITPIPIDQICMASLHFIKQIAHKRNIQLTFKPDAQLNLFQADGRRLKQMLINLLSNAVKFTPEGGQVGLEVTHTMTTGDAACHEVFFTVWDTGIGIPPEQQTLLFKPFVQLDGSLTRKYEGTGLGLALVHAMAELHGGRVTVQSAGAGLGSRFTIALPWTPDTSPQTSVDAPEVTSGFDSLKTLLGRPPLIMAVDDSAVTLTVLTHYLDGMGCQVLNARDGAEALAAWESAAVTAQPDLILLDVQLPGVDGLTVIRRLRAAGSTMPIIVLTALAMAGDRERCLEAGADDYLSKPVKLDELARTIARHLEKRHPH